MSWIVFKRQRSCQASVWALDQIAKGLTWAQTQWLCRSETLRLPTATHPRPWQRLTLSLATCCMETQTTYLREWRENNNEVIYSSLDLHTRCSLYCWCIQMCTYVSSDCSGGRAGDMLSKAKRGKNMIQIRESVSHSSPCPFGPMWVILRIAIPIVVCVENLFCCVHAIIKKI